jgi:hypothetical protein
MKRTFRSIAADSYYSIRRNAGIGAYDADVPTLLKELSQVGPEQGIALDSSLLTYMESRFCTNLREVRVHANEWSSKACELLGAKAFSWRNHIALVNYVHAPLSPEFPKVVAHEIAHIVQRMLGGSYCASAHLFLGDSGDPLELEADLVSEAILHGRVLPTLTADQTNAVRRSVNIDAKSARLTVNRQGATLGIATGTKCACAHLTQGFTSPDLPDLVHNLGNAFKITGDVDVLADTIAEANDVSQGRWTFNFIQVARVHTVSFTWEGRRASEGEVFVLASRPPAWPSNRIVSLDAEAGSSPFVNSNPHVGLRKRQQAGQPIGRASRLWFRGQTAAAQQELRPTGVI